MWQWYGYGPWQARYRHWQTGYGYGPWWGGPPAWPWPPIPKEQELAMLEDRARALEEELGAVRKRLEELRGEET